MWGREGVGFDISIPFLNVLFPLSKEPDEVGLGEEPPSKRDTKKDDDGDEDAFEREGLFLFICSISTQHPSLFLFVCSLFFPFRSLV